MTNIKGLWIYIHLLELSKLFLNIPGKALLLQMRKIVILYKDILCLHRFLLANYINF